MGMTKPSVDKFKLVSLDDTYICLERVEVQFGYVAPYIPKRQNSKRHTLSINKNMKSVRFQEPIGTFILNNDMLDLFESSKGDIENTWYSTRDFERFKDESKLVSKELRLFRKDRLLNGTIPISSEDTFEVHQAQMKLIHWCGNAGMGRGLERSICPSQGLQRRRERQKSILAVLQVQSLMLTRIVKDSYVEQIRLASISFTEKARGYARLMGIADEAAACGCYSRYGRAVVMCQH